MSSNPAGGETPGPQGPPPGPPGGGGPQGDPDKADLLGRSEQLYLEYLTAVIMTVQAAAECLDLHATDLYGLNVLKMSGAVTAGQLAERTGLTTGAATRLIDRLERAGFVHRVSDPADRRRVIVAPLPDRDQEIEESFGPIQERIAGLMSSFTMDELFVLLRYFQGAAPALRDAAEDMRKVARDRRRRTPHEDPAAPAS